MPSNLTRPLLQCNPTNINNNIKTNYIEIGSAPTYVLAPLSPPRNNITPSGAEYCQVITTPTQALVLQPLHPMPSMMDEISNSSYKEDNHVNLSQIN